MLRPGIAGMQGSMVIRLRPCMNIEYTPPRGNSSRSRSAYPTYVRHIFVRTEVCVFFTLRRFLSFYPSTTSTLTAHPVPAILHPRETSSVVTKLRHMHTINTLYIVLYRGVCVFFTCNRSLCLFLSFFSISMCLGW